MAALSTSASQLGNYLRDSGIRAEQGKNDSPVASEVRPLPYLEQWRLMTDRGWYSYRLEDHSLFVFVEEKEGLSFSYLPCPLDVESLRDFSQSTGIHGRDIYSAANQTNYEIYLSTASLREHVVPVRFDYDLRGYDERCHPLGHLHFGHNADTRIGTGRKWTPLAFGLFILRQHYPEQWRKLLTMPSAESLGRRIRLGLPVLERCYTDPIFNREVYLL